MAKRLGRAAWFKVFHHQKAVIDAMPDDAVGKGFKAAFQYFDSGEVPDLDQLAFVVFASLKPYIDEALDDYQRSVQAGQRGAADRWGKGKTSDSPPIAPPQSPLGVVTDADAETDADARGSKKKRVTSPESDALFDRFWAAYPKKVGKAAVRKKWAKLNVSEQLVEKMIMSLNTQRQSAQWQRDGGQYIPNPLTWLNQERWEDELGGGDNNGKNELGYRITCGQRL